ncbi:Endospore coat-associated protein YutH [Lentibacillus sp. JNUCC-1]|nr:Endospore coat-associated protein YutH [Lentibacillus sp. JNUCC-1]
MKAFLEMHYNIRDTYSTHIDNRSLLTDGEYVYLIIPVENKEAMYMEQGALSAFLHQNGYELVSRLLPNRNGEWVTSHEGVSYMLMYASLPRVPQEHSHGRQLAHLHAAGATQQFEPQHISSFGQWKQVWMKKLDLYEGEIHRQASQNESAYMNLLLDSLPYIIGIGENAIQYVQETEGEWRTNEFDIGTVCFHRYTKQLRTSVIWSHEFVFDHGVRDLAEGIRFYWIRGKEEEALRLLYDYTEVRPLSILAWRALYARLVMPLHVLDIIGESFLAKDQEAYYYEKLNALLAQQPDYEARLGRFYEESGVDVHAINVPVIHWL